MKTQCNKFIKKSRTFKKTLIYNFDGGNITSDGGLMLIQNIDKKLNLSERIANVLFDKRQASKVKHMNYDLVRQRLFQIIMGYEDCNDADKLRNDPSFKLSVGKLPETHDNLASQPTLTRFENSISKKDIYKLTELLVENYAARKMKSGMPDKIIFDIDATDDPAHGNQQYVLFHGYFNQYMYFPLHVFDGETGDLVVSLLRPGTVHSSRSAAGLLKRVLKKLREYFPDTEFIIRGDAGFGVPEMYNLCEQNGYKYALGLISNNVLNKNTQKLSAKAKDLFEKTKNKQKEYTRFKYQAGTWKSQRDVISKVEYNRHGSNIRYIVTNMDFPYSKIGYEFYSGRGKMENYIKDLKNDLFMGRLSCHKYLANCFRMLMSCFAYTLMHELRDTLKDTELEGKQTNTIRLKLLKIGARIKETTRRVWVYFSSSFAMQDLFNTLLERYS